MNWPVLDAERMRLRPPIPSDAAPLLAILAEPEVSRWWVGYSAERIRSEILESGNAEIIEIDGETAGAIFMYPESDPEYLHVVMHLFLGARWYGKRFGAEALATMIAQLARQGHHRFTLDPNVNNGPAIRSYERLGFRRVGILREYQLRSDGSYDDGLLMDLVLSDFPGGVDWRADATL